MLTEQSDEGKPSVEVLFSQVTLVCAKLTNINQPSQGLLGKHCSVAVQTVVTRAIFLVQIWFAFH